MAVGKVKLDHSFSWTVTVLLLADQHHSEFIHSETCFVKQVINTKLKIVLLRLLQLLQVLELGS